MTSGSLQPVLRHIHRLAGAHALGAPTDSELLARFAGAGEQTAFAALVRRHGPLVLGVCRRVLRQEQDAEDAFQATFLVLARKAGAITAGEALGGWLHAVALRTALEARRQAATRRRHEQRVPVLRPNDALAAVVWRDVQPVLDEEVQRLPPKCRAAFVLCYLEGKTYGQAATRLRCRPGTVSRRLSQARGLLRARLSRRGLALPAGLLAALLAEKTLPAAVPAPLAASTVRAALRGAAVVPAAAALAEGGIRVTAIKVTLAVAAALAGVVALARGGPAEQARSPAVAPHPAPQAAGGSPARPGPSDKEPRATGRVLGADGKPLGGASVVLLGLPRTEHTRLRVLNKEILGSTRADADGRFRLPVPHKARTQYEQLYALAGHPGHGLVWEPLRLDAPGAETVLRLPPEKVIRGRLLDLQGQPAAGVRVVVGWAGTVRPDSGKSTRLGALPRDRFPPWPGPVTTGADGRFVLRGVNPEHEGYLHFEGERFAFQWQALKPEKGQRVQEVNLSLAPAQIVEGVITAVDTGKPVPHARLMLNADDNPDSPQASGPGVTGQADAQGRFRLNPPPGRMYTLRAEPPAGSPYLRQHKSFRWPPGTIRRHVALALPRGVLVRGRVAEARSGKPIAGVLVRDAVGLWTNPTVETAADGRFSIAVAPGRGHLIFKGPGNDYIPVEATEADLEGGKPRGGRFYPDALVPLDLKPGAEPAELSVRLRRGVTIRGRLIGPGGKPPADAVLLCWSQVRRHVPYWFSAAVPVRDGRFELRGCDPERAYPLYFLDARNQLGASAKLSVKEAGGKEVTVRLSPCGSAAARFVDERGKSLAGFRAPFYFVVRPGPQESATEPTADSDIVANVDRLHYPGAGLPADAEGRCRYPALIPGATYRLLDYDLKVVREFRVAAGQALSLGDLVIRRAE
jgi:RNA polymerase sigma factor (sigma-70 family)